LTTCPLPTGSGQNDERVAVYKRPLHSLPVRAPWKCAAPQSGARFEEHLCVRSRSCDH
ncbi:unnamed protein product, partial [Staurois parvus]